MSVSNEKGNSPVTLIPNDYSLNDARTWFTLERGLDKGKKIFFCDKVYGSGDPISTIVLVHGNPECSYTYRNVVKRIVKRAIKPLRLIFMDHIGFGLSDQASYEMVSMDHSFNLELLVKYLNPKKVTLVIHDWGGPIGIGAFLKEPSRVKNLVILNSTVFNIRNAPINYTNYPISWLGWCNSPYIIPNMLWGDFAQYVTFLPPKEPIPILMGMIQSMTHSYFKGLNPNKADIKTVLKQQFASKSNVLSSKRLVLQTRYWGYGNTYYEPKLGKRYTAPFYRFIQENITKSWSSSKNRIGAYAVLGGWDPTGKDYVIKQWINHLPQLKGNITIFNDAGHFIEEVKSLEIGDTVLKAADLG